MKAIGTDADRIAVIANNDLKINAQKYTNVTFIDRDQLYSVNGVPSDLTKDGLPFSLDGGHISTYGAKKLAEEFIDSKAFLELKEKVRRIYLGR